MWARVVPVEGTVLDLLRIRMSWHYAPHIHEDYSIGACSEGLEVIRYRGTAHYAGPGSVVILEPGYRVRRNGTAGRGRRGGV